MKEIILVSLVMVTAMLIARLGIAIQRSELLREQESNEQFNKELIEEAKRQRAIEEAERQAKDGKQYRCCDAERAC